MNHRLWLRKPERNHFSILPEPGIIRVSNMFIVLCFPLGCFMPCQPHGIVSDILHLLPEYMYLLKTPTINVRFVDIFNSKVLPCEEKCPMSRLCRIIPGKDIVLTMQVNFFHSYIGQMAVEIWTLQDLNL